MYIHLDCNQKIIGGEFFATWWFRRQYWFLDLIIMIFFCEIGRRA